MQIRQHHRVAAVGLHPIARLYRNERRRNHDAVVTHLDELAVQTIAARSRFVAEMQFDTVSVELLHQLADMIGSCGIVPQYRTSPPSSPSATATVILPQIGGHP